MLHDTGGQTSLEVSLFFLSEKQEKGAADARVQVSSYLQDTDAVAQCDATFRGLFWHCKVLHLFGFSVKTSPEKKSDIRKSSLEITKSRPSYAPCIHDHMCMSNREQGGAGCSKWVSYGGALSDSLQRLDGMHSTRHVAAQQTMSIKIKPEQLPHLLSTSILYIE